MYAWQASIFFIGVEIRPGGRAQCPQGGKDLHISVLAFPVLHRRLLFQSDLSLEWFADEEGCCWKHSQDSLLHDPPQKKNHKIFTLTLKFYAVPCRLLFWSDLNI